MIVNQDWEFSFAHRSSLIRSLLICSSLICSSLIRSRQMSSCERIAQDYSNKLPWANRSGHSGQKSDHEWFAQVVHDKRENEQIAHLLFRSQKMSNLLNKFDQNRIFCSFFVRFFVHFLKKQAICSFPLYYWEMWANRSGCSPKMSNVSVSLRSLTKKEQMSKLLVFLS